MTRPKEGYFIMYLRRSRADIEKEKYGKFNTLASHEKTLTELAARRNMKIGAIYRELVSGESIEERDEFKKVLEHITDPLCLGVLVHAIDRLGRGGLRAYSVVSPIHQHDGHYAKTRLRPKYRGRQGAAKNEDVPLEYRARPYMRASARWQYKVCE